MQPPFKPARHRPSVRPTFVGRTPGQRLGQAACSVRCKGEQIKMDIEPKLPQQSFKRSFQWM